MLILYIYFCSLPIPNPHLPKLDECPAESQLPYCQTTAGATQPAMCALIPLLLVLPEIHHRGSQHIRQHCNNCQGKRLCLCLRKTSAVSLNIYPVERKQPELKLIQQWGKAPVFLLQFCIFSKIEESCPLKPRVFLKIFECLWCAFQK